MTYGQLSGHLKSSGECLLKLTMDPTKNCSCQQLELQELTPWAAVTSVRGSRGLGTYQDLKSKWVLSRTLPPIQCAKAIFEMGLLSGPGSFIRSLTAWHKWDIRTSAGRSSQYKKKVTADMR